MIPVVCDDTMVVQKNNKNAFTCERCDPTVISWSQLICEIPDSCKSILKSFLWWVVTPAVAGVNMNLATLESTTGRVGDLHDDHLFLLLLKVHWHLASSFWAMRQCGGRVHMFHSIEGFADLLLREPQLLSTKTLYSKS